MKFTFDGPMCIITEIGNNKNDVKILIPRIATDKGDLRMNLSNPEDEIHWVTVYITKKDSNGEKVVKPVHIECASYEEVIALVDAIQGRHSFLIKQRLIEKKRPWLRAHRVMLETQEKETKCSSSM